jgi:hypothetical protein
MGNFVLAYPTEEYPDQPTQGLQGLYDRILAGASDLFQVQGGHSSYFTSLCDMSAFNKSNDNTYGSINKKTNENNKDDYNINNDYTHSNDTNNYDSHNNDDDVKKKKFNVNGNYNHNHDKNHSNDSTASNESQPYPSRPSTESQNPSRPMGIRYLFESNHTHCFHRTLLDFDSSPTSSIKRVHSIHRQQTCTLLIDDINIFEYEYFKIYLYLYVYYPGLHVLIYTYAYSFIYAFYIIYKSHRNFFILRPSLRKIRGNSDPNLVISIGDNDMNDRNCDNDASKNGVFNNGNSGNGILNKGVSNHDRTALSSSVENKHKNFNQTQSESEKSHSRVHINKALPIVSMSMSSENLSSLATGKGLILHLCLISSSV